jgi:predicted Mrr-cat superfamily restriction endonuclease
MRDGGVVAIGWPELGDLSAYSNNQESRDAVKELLEERYPGSPQSVGRAASQLIKFVAGMQEGDLVLAADGMAILGVGEIAGGYQFAPGQAFPHQRPVSWRSLEEWDTVEMEALRTTVGVIRDYRNQVEAERHVLDDAESLRFVASSRLAQHEIHVAGARVGESTPPTEAARLPLARLAGVPAQVQSVLER